jgi:1,4-dihydroxy-6-naphthoate synthase
VLLPGPNTTAHLLFRLYGPSEATVEHVIFSDILPRLSAGSADMGVCIHEGRFVYQSLGLDLVLDLGARWEADTQDPLPLGGIAARRSVPATSMAAVDEAIRASLAWAQAHEAEALELCRRHAQELDEHVLRAHIELYVNAHTTDLGTVGVHALNVLSERARAVGLVAAQTPPLLVRATLAPC